MVSNDDISKKLEEKRKGTRNHDENINGSSETEGWWKKQGTGVKAAIGIVGVCCLGILLIVGLSAMMSPDKTTSTSTQSSTVQPTTTTQTAASNNSSTTSQSTASAASQDYIEVSCPSGSWDGSITIQSGNNEEELNFDGSGTKRFDLTPYKDKDVYINAQKNNDGSGKLSAVIVRNSETKLSQSTTEGYGIVNGWVFSWE